MFDAKGCTTPVIGHDGSPHPCGLPVVAFLWQSDRDGGGGYRGVCQRHARQTDVMLAPLAEVPDPLPFALTYEDYDGEDGRPREGDYGWAVRYHAGGQDEMPFHIEREKDTGMLVALLNDRLYARPEDDIEDGQYVSLLQLHIDGFDLYRTSGTHEPDGKRKGSISCCSSLK